MKVLSKPLVPNLFSVHDELLYPYSLDVASLPSSVPSLAEKVLGLQCTGLPLPRPPRAMIDLCVVLMPSYIYRERYYWVDLED